MGIFNFIRPFKRGCLYDKTEEEKISFFRSLSNFATTNKVFFEQQYWDMLPEERREFGYWVTENTNQLNTIKLLLNIIEKLT